MVSLQGMGRSSMDKKKRMEDSKDERSSIRMPSLHPVIPMRVALQRCPFPFHWTTMEYAYVNMESMFNQNFITCLSCPCLKNSKKSMREAPPLICFSLFTQSVAPGTQKYSFFHPQHLTIPLT
jgi:hypothetical protein